MRHYFENVPGLGNVAVSRHAQDRCVEDRISEDVFTAVLLNAESVPDGIAEVTREASGVRLVILLKPTPFRGAALVKTAFRVRAQARVRPR